MNDPKRDIVLQLSDFDFDLPEELIALEPLPIRDHSRLLHVRGDDGLVDRTFRDLLSFFEAGDVLVLNDSRVLPAALSGIRRRGEYEARVHFNLHKRLNENEWLAFAKPMKRLKVGDRLLFGDDNQACMMGSLEATVKELHDGGEVLLSFDVSGAVLNEQLKNVGSMPLPPYIAGRRAANDKDRISYQTVYAQDEGSVAAPTAGLHFTTELLDEFRAKGVDIQFVTLHVGAGTFLPVKIDNIEDHKMHAEWGEVSEGCVEAITRAHANGKRVTGVGTTSLRLLESAARQSGLAYGLAHGLAPWQGETDIFIRPGFEFKVVDRLITNFHLPKSTLFMLVSAFSGFDVMQQAYAHAIDQGYRFYSYGDACFLERSE